MHALSTQHVTQFVICSFSCIQLLLGALESAQPAPAENITTNHVSFCWQLDLAATQYRYLHAAL